MSDPLGLTGYLTPAEPKPPAPRPIPFAKPSGAIPEIPEGAFEPNLAEIDRMASLLANAQDVVRHTLETSSDPLDTLDRIKTSAFLADRMGLSLEYTVENLDDVSRNYWGQVIPPKGQWQVISEAWKASSMRQRMYLLQFQRLMGRGSPELDEQVAEIRRQLPSPDTEARPWWVEVGKATADMLPYWWEALKFSAPIAAGTAGAAAAIAASAGPAAPVSIPGAAIATFLRTLTLGTRVYTFESEAGATFDTLLDIGADEDLARAIAIPIGAGKAALEGIQIANIPGLSGLKLTIENAMAQNLSKDLLQRGLITKIANRVADRARGPLARGAARFGVEYVGKGLGAEPATEVAQEALDMFAESAAKAWMKAATGVNIPQATAEESWNRIWETWKQTAMAMVATGLPGSLKAGLGATGRAMNQRVAERQAAPEAQVIPEESPATVKISDVAPEAPAAGELQTSAIEPGVRLTREPSATGIALITNQEETQTYGRMEYRSDARSADILSLQFVPGQEERARDTVLEFMKKNAGKQVQWDPADPAGIALREDLVANNPRRAELQSSIDELAQVREQQTAALATAADEGSRLAIAADLGRLELEIQRVERRQKRIGLQWYTEAPLTEESTVEQVQSAQEALPEDPWRVGKEEYSQLAEQAGETEADRAFLSDPARRFLGTAFPGWNRGEVDLAATLMDLGAQAKGMATQAWMDRYLAPGLFKRYQESFLPAELFSKLAPDAFALNQAKIAATEFLTDGRALLHLSQSATFSSFVHELAHVYRRQLSEGDLAIATTWAGAQQGWTRDAEEAWANGLEEYLREGNTPSPELASIFARFTEWLKRIYQVLAARVEISPDIRRVYDRLFTTETPAVEGATAAAAAEEPILFQPGESAETPSSRLNRLLTMPAVAIETPQAWKDADLPTMWKLAEEQYRTLRPVVNADTGKTVHFVFTAFRDLQSHGAARSLMAMVPHLRALMEKAVLLWQESDKKGRSNIFAVHNFGARLEIDGWDMFARLIAREEKKGGVFVDIFHDASLVDAENARGLLQPAIPLPMRATTETSPAGELQSAGLQPIQGRAETLSTRDKLLDWIRAVKAGELDDTTAQTRRVLEDPAFRDWFAGSQATDEQGRPRVFFHGTYATFSSFEQSRDLGYHFGSSEQAVTKVGGENAREGARVIPVYLSIKNPLRLVEDVFSRFDQVPIEQAAEVISQAAGLDEQQAAALRNQAAHVGQLRETLGPADQRYVDAQERFWDQVQRALQGKGFDGVVYPNAVEGAGESWIAFQPNQVKSVFNKGTWSQSPNILFQEGPEQPTEGAPENAQASAEHEQSTKEAVQAGEAVPDEVLAEYKQTEWASQEEASRIAHVKDAQSFDLFDDFRDYANSMASPEDPPHSVEYWSMIWDRAKNEQTVDRRTADARFLESLDTKEKLSAILLEAAHKERLGGLHPVMAAVAKRLRGGKTMSEAAYKKIMAQIKDDPTRWRAEFASIEGNEEAIRQLLMEQRAPAQKETLEERLRRENRALRQQVTAGKEKVALSAREARIEKSYSQDLERKLKKLEAAHNEKVASMKLQAAEKRKEQTIRSSERGRERIRSLRDSQAVARDKQRANRKVREKFNKEIRELRRIQSNIPYMHPDAKGPLTALLEDVLLKRTSPKRMLRLKEIREKMESNPEYEMSDSMKETLAELDKKSVRDMTVGDFETLYNAIRHYANRNTEIQAMRIGSEKRRQEDVLRQAAGELRKAKPLVTDEFSEEGIPPTEEIVGDRGKHRRGLRSAYDTFLGMGQDHFNLIVERIAGKDSIIHRLLVRGIEEGRRTQLAYKDQVHRRFQAAIAGLGVNNITAWLTEDTFVDRFELRRGEKLALWMHAQNEDNKESILVAGFGLKRRDGDHRFTISESELTAVLATVTDQEKVFLNAVQRLFEQQGRDLGEVFLEKNGYELPLVEAYYPKEVMAIGRGSDASKDELLDRVRDFIRLGIAKGMTKERKQVAVPLYLNNIAYDVERSVRRSAAYIGFEIPLTQASRLLYDKSFREDLSNRFSPRLWQEIERGLRDVAGEFKEIEGVERLALKFRSGLTMAFLGFNPYSILKQPLSLGNALPYVKARYLVQGLAETIGRGKEIFDQHRANSPYFNERLEVGFTRDIADAARVRGEGRLYGAKTLAQRLGFLGIKSADAFTVASVMRGAWLQAMDELEGKATISRELVEVLDLKNRSIANLTVDQRNELAYRWADHVSTRSQDQALPEYRSGLSRSPWGKFFTMFGSSSNVALNILRRSIVDVQQHGGDATAVRKLAMTVLAIGVMGPVGEAAVNMLRITVRAAMRGEEPPPDEEKLRAWIAQYLQSVGGLVYFVRDATNRAISTWQYGPFANSTDTTNPIGFLADSVQGLIATGVSAIAEDDYLERRRKWTRFIDQFSLVSSILTQMPLYMPTKALTRVFGEQPERKRR